MNPVNAAIFAASLSVVALSAPAFSQDLGTPASWGISERAPSSRVSAVGSLTAKIEPVTVYPEPSPSDCRKAEASYGWASDKEEMNRLFRVGIICRNVPRAAYAVVDAIEHNPNAVHVIWNNCAVSLAGNLYDNGGPHRADPDAETRKEAVSRLNSYVLRILELHGNSGLLGAELPKSLP